jgi:CRP-like cAMP-binding protein
LAINKELPKVYRLQYKKGEQIFKQNDFGVSIYKILRGRVEVFRECEGVEISIAHLESGGILGEMIFFLKSTEIRSASARAVEDSEIEVWHPMEVLRDYDNVSPVLKLIAKQELDRLIRMNKFMDNLIVQKKMEAAESSVQKEPWKGKRRFYRKNVNLPCTYRMERSPKGFSRKAKGTINNLSMTGLCLDMASKNKTLFSHDIGELFTIETVLPNGKDFSGQGRVVRETESAYTSSLGIAFSELTDEARKVLGFFLLPA